MGDGVDPGDCRVDRMTIKGETCRYSHRAQNAARHGYNFVGLGPAAAVRGHVDLYWQTWESHRGDPGRLNAHVAAPKVGIRRQVVVADTDGEALATTRASRLVPLDYEAVARPQ